MERKQLNIGLFGFGCVGYGLHQVLAQTTNVAASIKYICVKNKNKMRQIVASNFVFDKHIILDDAEINVVVELIDDADEAFEIVKKAMQNGKAVVSANKKMIAEHFDELRLLQKQYEVPFLYEGSVCASIPIIRNLEEYYNNDLLTSVEGIVNGSTNYILTKIEAENTSYQIALQQAQENGYAESNPILDTGGFDAKYKLLILLAHAFGLVVQPKEILNIGIDGISPLAIKYAKENGLKIKLIAHAIKINEKEIVAVVAPKLIASSNQLYRVDDVYNGVCLQTAFAESQFFVGKGAGAHPTASAVLSDISALTFNYRYEYHKIKINQYTLVNNNRIVVGVLLSASIEDIEALKHYFSNITETYSNHTDAYIIGKIGLQDLQLINIAFDACIILISIMQQPTTTIEAQQLAFAN
jgi:homoserine dehydrogenase